MRILISYRMREYFEEPYGFKRELNKHLNKNHEITIVVDSGIAKRYIQNKFMGKHKCIIEVYKVREFLEKEINLRFDYIVANPPYQINKKSLQSFRIWDELSVKFIKLLKEGGELNIIHPGGWRFLTKQSRKESVDLLNLYKKYNIISMELNDDKKGKETFGAGTDYDVIYMRKELNKGRTKVITSDETITIDLRDYDIIPTSGIKIFNKLRAKDNDEKIEFLYSYSDYETRKSYISKVKDNEYKYPVLYTINDKQGDVFYYSNTKDKGHFGLSKIIIRQSAKRLIIDKEGLYGMTQFACAIVDKPENLEYISKQIEKYFPILSSLFTGVYTKNALTDNKGTMFKFIKEFKKEWYKDDILKSLKMTE